MIMDQQQQQQQAPPYYDQRMYYQQDVAASPYNYHNPMYAQQQPQQPQQQDPYYRLQHPSQGFQNAPGFQEYKQPPPLYQQQNNQMPARMPQPELQRYDTTSMMGGFDFSPVFPSTAPPSSTAVGGAPNVGGNNSHYSPARATSYNRDTLSTSPLLDPASPNRVQLRIEGDLDAMCDGWTPDEWAQRRRLVQFWRDEEGQIIRCGFQPVAQEAHRGQVNTIEGFTIVSCIYWPERNDYFITSVDLIHLLEVVMHMQFTVEEKNRVRRNLEGFRPLTVSKSRPESTDFFKLIMNFPHPKPRNIEKDLKVFPWRTLGMALNKIVAKYRMVQK